MLCPLIYSILRGEELLYSLPFNGFTLSLIKSNIVIHVGLDTVQLSWNQSA